MSSYLIIIRGTAPVEMVQSAESMTELLKWLRKWAKDHRRRLSDFDVYRMEDE